MAPFSFYCLLIALHSSYHFVGASNSPISNQGIKQVRPRMGSTAILNCRLNNSDINWQFRPCDVNYRGMDCENDVTYHTWERLDEFKSRRNLKIESAKLEHSGVYRCISEHIIRKVFLVQVVVENYFWPPPKIISVIPSNFTINPNGQLTINCSVYSKTPPKILWFKECSENICGIDLKYYHIRLSEENCLCLINTTKENNLYNFKDTYISKLRIYKAHIWDTGNYFCTAISSQGKDYKQIFIQVNDNEICSKSYLLLFSIPLCFILLYIFTAWFIRKRNFKDNGGTRTVPTKRYTLVNYKK